MQSENYQLREYIINLQSRLLDTQGEVPEVPGNIDLSQPRTDMPLFLGASAMSMPLVRPTQRLVASSSTTRSRRPRMPSPPQMTT